MKVIVAVILALGSVSAGSGPYLPSGWRPSGPAFYLPSEVQKPVENPLKETLLFESEASGSEGLREYGPPKIILNVKSEASGSEGLKEYGHPKETLIVQVLPDVVTDQTFYAVGGSASVELQQVAEVNVEQKADIAQEVTTEAQFTEATSQDITDTVDNFAYLAVTDAVDTEVTKPVETTEKIDVVTEQAEVVTEQAEVVTEQAKVVTEQAEVVTEQAKVVTEQAEEVTDKVEVVEEAVEIVADKAEVVEVVSEVKEVEATVAAVEDKLENIIIAEEKLGNIVVQEEEKIVEAVQDIRNIAETLVNVENEVKAEEIQQSIEPVVELKVVAQEESEVKVPEGFLEYGPPGFREYGPPKGDELLRSVSENEVRRRRFSPKFRSSVNKKH